MAGVFENVEGTRCDLEIPSQCEVYQLFDMFRTVKRTEGMHQRPAVIGILWMSDCVEQGIDRAWITRIHECQSRLIPLGRIDGGQLL